MRIPGFFFPSVISVFSFLIIWLSSPSSFVLFFFSSSFPLLFFFFSSFVLFLCLKRLSIKSLCKLCADCLVFALCVFYFMSHITALVFLESKKGSSTFLQRFFFLFSSHESLISWWLECDSQNCCHISFQTASHLTSWTFSLTQWFSLDIILNPTNVWKDNSLRTVWQNLKGLKGVRKDARQRANKCQSNKISREKEISCVSLSILVCDFASLVLSLTPVSMTIL